MRITRDKFVRRYVYDWAVGDVPVKRVMRNGVQIWPSKDARIRTMTVDFDLENPYWIHGLHAIEADAKASVTLTIGHRKYSVNASNQGLPVVRYALGIFDFGDDGPIVEDARRGDEIKLVISVAERGILLHRPDISTGPEIITMPPVLKGSLLLFDYRGSTGGQRCDLYHSFESENGNEFHSFKMYFSAKSARGGSYSVPEDPSPGTYSILKVWIVHIKYGSYCYNIRMKTPKIYQTFTPKITSITI